MSKTLPVVAGVEIGGTKLQLALGRGDGTILVSHRGSVDPRQGARGILEWLERELPAFLREAAQIHGQPEAVGIGFGGPVETATGRVLTSHQIEGWKGVELRTWCEDRFHLPAVVANDANAAGWAEYCCGAGRGTRVFCYMNVGSGIGGALVIDGKLHDGQGFGAGEIGHTYVPDWTSNAPGAADKLEHICSGWRIEQRIRQWKDLAPGSVLDRLCGGQPGQLTCAMLAEAARQNDLRAADELDRVADSVAIALSNVITLFHPERIAMGGGVSLMGGVLLDRVRQKVAERVFGPFQDHYEILPCALAESVVVVGAVLLAGAGAREQ
jgi:glucokinase